jgi:hypothetical protein
VFQVETQAVEHHLHGDQDQDHAHEPLDGPHAACAEQAHQALAQHQHGGREHRGEGHRQHPLHHAPGMPVGQQEQEGHAAGAGDERGGQGHDERLLFALPAHVHPPIGKHHADRDQKQHDAAGDAERRLLQPEEAQQLAAQQQETQQQQVGDQRLAHHHPPPPLHRHAAQDRLEQRHVPERIENQQQGDSGGEEGHTTPSLTDLPPAGEPGFGGAKQPGLKHAGGPGSVPAAKVLRRSFTPADDTFPWGKVEVVPPNVMGRVNCRGVMMSTG